MAKDKSEKKHKKSKEVTEEVAGAIAPAGDDVEMSNAEVAKVSLVYVCTGRNVNFATGH